jgi:hypothetical protein
MKRIYSILVLTMLFCVGCEWRFSSIDEHPEWLLSVSRYDRIESLYLTTGDFSALQQMNTDYPQQTRTLIEDVLHIGQVNDPQINAKFLRFFQDTILQTVIADTQHQYADMSDINEKLSDAFEQLLKLLPDLCIPEIYAQIGSFDQSIIVDNDLIGISLDKYLGSDYPYYKKFGYRKDQLRQMQRDNIVPDCIGFYLLSLFPLPSSREATQQERDRHIGRIQWVVNRVMKRSFFSTPYVAEADRYMKSHRQTTVEQLLRFGTDAGSDLQ